MSGETWTEYGVKFREGVIEANTRAHAEEINGWNDGEGIVVGRQVTASDWLPVQDQPTPPAGYVSPLPLHRTEANYGVVCGTCDGGGCPDCTDPA